MIAGAVALAPLCGAAFSLLGGRAMIAAGTMDLPDQTRKLHAAPIPRAGGVAIALAFALAFTAVSGEDRVREPAADAISTGLACAAALFVLGLADDLRPLPARVKFPLGAMICLVFAALAGRIEILPFSEAHHLALGPVVGALGAGLWLFTLANGVNFMDGANGMAGGSVAIGLFWLAVIGLWRGAPEAGLAAFALMGAVIGFLRWNFPRARLFMGDCGSLFIGFLSAALALIEVRAGALSVYLAPVLFFPILADVLLTLAFRVRARRRVLEAHREHLYQLLIRSGAPHWRASAIYWSLAFNCGLMAAGANLFGPKAGLGLLALCALGGVLISRAMRRAAAEIGLDAP